MLHIPSGKLVAVDTETTGLSPWKGDMPYAISFCNEDGETGYVRWKVDPYSRRVIVRRSELVRLREWFSDPSLETVWFNKPFDLRMLRKLGINVAGKTHELMVAMFYFSRTVGENIKLKPLAMRYANIGIEDEIELKRGAAAARRMVKKKAAGYGKYVGDEWKMWKLGPAVEADMWMAPENLAEEYAVGDAQRTMLLWIMASKWLHENDLWDVYEQELETMEVTQALVERGVMVDRVKLNVLMKWYNKILVDRLAKMREAVGPDFEPNKHAQLRKYLYVTKGYPVTQQTKTGLGKTDWQTLRGIQDPVIAWINDYRVADKTVGTYLRSYVEKAIWGAELNGNLRYGVLHPEFVQIGPHTGRYACRQPNLQNTADPAATRSSLHSDIVVRARECIIPRPGSVWLHFDQAQIEPRIFADRSQDETMLEAFRQGRDIHTENTNRLWGHNVRRAAQLLRQAGEPSDSVAASEWLRRWEYDIVKAEESLGQKLTRGLTKAILFVKFYGGGAKAMIALMQGTISHKEAIEALNEFDRLFPRIRSAIRELEQEGRENGYIETAFGRRIIVDPEYAYRATNYYVQGTAADLLKRLMLKAYRFVQEKRWDIHQVLTLHDEIVFEWPRKMLLRKYVEPVKRVLEDHGGVFCLETPVDVEISWEDWGHQEKFVYGKWRLPIMNRETING